MNFNLGKDGEVKVILVPKGAETVKDANELYSCLKDKDLFKGGILVKYMQMFLLQKIKFFF